jgi:prefoldin subunit 5
MAKQSESVNESIATLKKQVEAVATYPKLRDHVKEMDKDIDKLEAQLKELYKAIN